MKNRLKEFMDYKKLSGADLADTIGVQRSNVSHILNGRNNPGAQFIEKLLLAYPDLDAGWLLTGKGAMINAAKGPLQTTGTVQMTSPGKLRSAPVDEEQLIPLLDTLQKPDGTVGKAEFRKGVSVKKIERIVVFYEDRSFIDYIPG